MKLMLLMALMLQQDIEMADLLRKDGKFWSVILVILVVFIGILGYLFLLDKKISKLEKEN